MYSEATHNSSSVECRYQAKNVLIAADATGGGVTRDDRDNTNGQGRGEGEVVVSELRPPALLCYLYLTGAFLVGLRLRLVRVT